MPILSEKESYSNLIKTKAIELGFYDCGISQAEFLEKEAAYYDNWLKKMHHGSMSYLERNIDKRLDPRLLVEGARSVISMLYNYYPENKLEDTAPYKISKYAYGKDYHKIIKRKLKQLANYIKEVTGKIQIRGFVDSSPVLERSWAVKSGLGWIGKNGNLITLKNGSFFFICELITDLELIYDQPIKNNYCGNCSLCISACPTKAIVAPYQLDASKCISYLTIELKDQIPDVFKHKYTQWVFGCDICQDVCPWNRFSIFHREDKFNLHPDLFKLSKKEWEELTEKKYHFIFEGSAIERAKYQGLKRNIDFLTLQVGFNL
ncbi:tRNA epoxyqueuosine(34) reductase QueG [candidate division KSB1 bacterium]